MGRFCRSALLALQRLRLDRGSPPAFSEEASHVREQPKFLCRAIALRDMFRVKFLYLRGPKVFAGGRDSTCLFLVSYASHKSSAAV